MQSKGIFFLAGFILFTIFKTAAQTENKRLFDLVLQANSDTSLENRIALLSSALSISQGCVECEALCHAKLGEIYGQTNRYEAAYTHLHTAIQLRRKLGDSLRVAGNLTNIALFKYQEGHFAQAVEMGLKALAILEEQQGDQARPDTLLYINITNIYAILSNIQESFGNYKEALRYAQKSLETCKFTGSINDLYDTYYALANRYFSLFQEVQDINFADSAEYYYREFLHFAEQHQDVFDIVDQAHTHHNLASLAINKRDFATARQEIAYSTDLYSAESELTGIVDVEILNANVFIEQSGNFAKALERTRRAQNLMNQVSIDTTVQLEIYKLLSICYEALHQPDSALKYSRQAEALYLQLFTSQQSKFNEIDRANLEKRNELERNVSNLEIGKSKSRQRLWASLATILGLLAAIGGLIWRYREHRQQIRISQQNKEIEDTLKDAQVRFLQGIIEGQQLERKETKHILHNDIANTVLSLSYEIENAQPLHPKQKIWSSELLKLAAHTRRLSHQKGGLIHDIGLFEGINDLLNRIKQTNQIEVEFITNLHQLRLDALVEVELWHIIQELVGNTLKYAQASRIELSIDVEPQAIYITYHDNGNGFDYNQVLHTQKSLGLNSVFEKTQSLGGPVPNINTAPGHGFTISIEIPNFKSDLS